MDNKEIKEENSSSSILPLKNIIIDTDSGIDDIISIAVALKHEKTRLRAITVVEGNTSLKQGLLNLCSLLDINTLATKKIPIYPGCDKPIIQEFNRDKQYSSSTFNSFNSYSLPERNRIEHYVEKEHAVMALLRMVNKEPNELSIVCLGPLTNIALAIRLDPFFLSKVKDIVVMGGCLYAKGNSTRVAEYAFNYDPEAAHILFTASKQYAMENPHCTQPKLTVVPWEVAVEQGLDWNFYDYLIQTPPINEFTNIIKELSSIKELLFRNSHENILSLSSTNSGAALQTSNTVLEYQINATKFIMCDLYTLVCAIEPDRVIKEFQDLDVEIELHGKYSRGMTCFDWLGSQNALNARVVIKINKDIIKTTLINSFKQEAKPKMSSKL